MVGGSSGDNTLSEEAWDLLGLGWGSCAMGVRGALVVGLLACQT